MSKFINPYTDFGFKKLFGEEANKDFQFDKWCYFLKNLENFESIPTILNEPIFTKAFEEAALANMTAQERDDYEQSLIHYRDLKCVVETAVEEAVESREIEIAKTMLANNEPNEKIMLYTGLSKEQVERLRIELKNKK